MASCVETEGKEDNTMNSSADSELIQWLTENNLQQVISTFKDENMTMDELMEYGEDVEILKQYLGQLGIAAATITRICFKIKKRLKNDKNNKPNPITKHNKIREKLLQNEQAIKSQINAEYNNLINLISNNQEIVLRKLSEIVNRKQLEINQTAQQNKIIDEVSAHITFEFNKNSIAPFLSNLTTIYGEERHPMPIIDGIKIVQLTNTQCTVQWGAVLSQDLATKTTCKLYMKIKAVNDEMDEKQIEQLDSDLILFDADTNRYEYKMNELRKNTLYKMKICLFQGKKNDKYSIKPREDIKPLLFNFKTLGYDFCAKTFLYKSDYDENGIIWFLGTNYGQEPWRNPAKRGLIMLHCCGWSTGHIDDMVGRVVVSSYINNYNNEPKWVIIDFGNELKIQANAYTLRHSNSHSNYYLRNWNLEGRNNERKWTIIKQHVNDTSLNEKGQSHTWEVSNCNEYYQQFRIKMTGTDASGSWHLMAIGFEIYGDLRGNQWVPNFDDIK